ncbi:cytosolic thiouridylase subunit Ctu1 [Tilletia horrida]|uniref:Cytoplasmic tRNA 2-thiolation protein 1 n=1 Tax=Tilletia horrida TaxID=155126 RepID=A0AAN6JM91_9BASI|nr:cytosolic thiouridylase subunit Ctu1 [Tilletia horrida]
MATATAAPAPAPAPAAGSSSSSSSSSNARLCVSCQTARAVLKRPKTGESVCQACFFHIFETEIHNTIVSARLFTGGRGERVAIGASGGKDSTVLAYVLKTLNERYDYGLDLFLLSIDEGITGYRDDSLETVKRNQEQYALPLKILGYDELYGWSMDDIVRQVGRKNNCTYCGVFRRQALDRGAASLGIDHIVTGHNADDIAETVLMNILRGDIARLERCTEIITRGPDMDSKPGGSCGGQPQSTNPDDIFGGLESIRRSKPFKYAYEKEIVMYAYFKKLDYFSTECIYSPNAYRGYARAFLKDLEAIRPSAIIDIIHSGESLKVKSEIKRAVQRTCSRCGYISSNELCKACVLLEGLNRGNSAIGIRSERSRAVKDALSLPAVPVSAVPDSSSSDPPSASAKDRIQSARAAAAAFAL